MGLGFARRNWETTFAGWAQSPSQTEMQKCERAVAAIKRAIDASPQLANRSITPFAQGSFRNRTNVRQDSDVDVCVFSSETYFFDLPPGLTLQSIGGTPATYSFNQYKADVQAALEGHFGTRNVARGNKAFDIHENTYRIDADAAPCFEYRLYFHDLNNRLQFVKGTVLFPDDASWHRITNFPEQQYASGVAKNDATGRRFKALVRIIKRLRSEMADARIPAAEPMASFLIESLAWNYPTELFATNSWTTLVKNFLTYVWHATEPGNEALTRNWRETNEIKNVFSLECPWTRAQVNAFALAAFSYIDRQ